MMLLCQLLPILWLQEASPEEPAAKEVTAVMQEPGLRIARQETAHLHRLLQYPRLYPADQVMVEEPTQPQLQQHVRGRR